MWRRLKCWFGFHDYEGVRKLSFQTMLVRCPHCDRHWAAKMEGDYRGAMIPWEKAKALYDKWSKCGEKFEPSLQCEDRRCHSAGKG